MLVSCKNKNVFMGPKSAMWYLLLTFHTDRHIQKSHAHTIQSTYQGAEPGPAWPSGLKQRTTKRRDADTARTLTGPKDFFNKERRFGVPITPLSGINDF